MQQKADLAWKLFCICVFDKVHRVLNDHPYRKLKT
jgi:hypothetical protein